MYYFFAAISYRLITNEMTTKITEQPAETAASAPVRPISKPCVPHLPNIIERSFSMIPSNDASVVRQQERT